MQKFKEFLKSWGTVIIAVLLIRAFIIEAFTVPTGSMEDTILPGDFLLVNKFVYGFKIPFTINDLIPGRRPKRGEVVIFRYPVDPPWPKPEERYVRFFPKWFPLLPIYWDKERSRFHWEAPRNFVKRCIAIEKDTVEIINKKVFINGEPIFEPYATHKDPYVFSSNYRESQEKWVNREYINAFEVRDNFGPVVVPEGYIFVMGDNRDYSHDSRHWGPLPVKFVKGRPLVVYFALGPGNNLIERLLRIRWGKIGKVIR